VTDRRRTLTFRMSWIWDDIKYSAVANWIDGLVHIIKAIYPSTTEETYLTELALALRRLAYSRPRALANWIWRKMSAEGVPDRYRVLRIGWRKFGAEFDNGIAREDATRIRTSVLLRAPSSHDKGILYISFEYNWLKLVAADRLKATMRHFYVVGASSWSPPDYACFSSISGASDDPFFVGISNSVDSAAYSVAAPQVLAVSQLAGDWVDPSEFRPLPYGQRDIDIIMISHWAAWKRHCILFDALSKLPRELNVVLIGRDVDGRTAETLFSEAAAFGVKQQISAFTNIDSSAVRRLLSRSKIAVALSAREGSCVAVAEALAADCPVVCLKNSRIGSLKYINLRTGRKVTRSGLVHAIWELLESREDLCPQQWYERNSGCWNSSARLNEELRQYADSRGRYPAESMVPLKWTYVPTYARKEDEEKLRGARDFLARECGVELADFVPPESGKRCKAMFGDRAAVHID
jgi:glycosyltransferase involved in cell wall biosynthesis